MPLRAFVKDQTYRLVTSLFGDKDKMITLPVLNGPAKGLRVRADITGRKEAYFWGKYDRYILEEVMPLVQPGWTVWDCGTYLGFYTMIFARKVGLTGKVVAIELDNRNLRRTRENVGLNRLANVQFVNAAIGAPAGDVEFVMHDGTNSHLMGNYAGGPDMKAVWSAKDETLPRGRVECISLDQAILDKHLPVPNLIKMDVEGAEKEALEHASYLFERIRPLLLMELHNHECDNAAWKFSRRFRYELKSLETGKILTRKEDVQGTLLCRPL